MRSVKGELRRKMERRRGGVVDVDGWIRRVEVVELLKRGEKEKLWMLKFGVVIGIGLGMLMGWIGS